VSCTNGDKGDSFRLGDVIWNESSVYAKGDENDPEDTGAGVSDQEGG
jgi:hypothetical protein